MSIEWLQEYQVLSLTAAFSVIAQESAMGQI